MTAPDLFDVPESLSPLRQFVKDYDVRRAESAERDPEERWSAWFRISQLDRVLAPPGSQCGVGATEEEAIQALAVRWGWLSLGNEERRPVRCEVEWWDARIDRAHWLPGLLLRRHIDGRCHVRTECGRVCLEAAPECVRLLPPA